MMKPDARDMPPRRPTPPLILLQGSHPLNIVLGKVADVLTPMTLQIIGIETSSTPQNAPIISLKATDPRNRMEEVKIGTIGPRNPLSRPNLL